MLGFPASFAHGSFALNGQYNADGSKNRSGVHTAVTIDERQFNTAFRDVRDPYHLAQGGQLGRIHKNFLTLQLGGRIQSPNTGQNATQSDVERAMRAAFDPTLCLRDSPTTLGAYQFQFSERTLDTVNWAGGILPLQYWMRPLEEPRIVEVAGPTPALRYGLSLIAADPRAYGRTEQTLALSSGTPSGNTINLGTSPSALKATIVMSGAGASNFRITRAGVIFQMNLSGLAAGTVVVVMETCAPYGIGRSITRSGVSIFSTKTSDASTWLDVPVGTTGFTITNLTGITSVTLAYYHSWA